MAGINLNQVPANINTIERMIGWAAIMNKAVYPDLVFNEFQNTTDLVFQSGVAECGDKTTRLIVRAALRLKPDWDTSEDPLWMSIEEFNQAQIPARFLRQ